MIIYYFISPNFHSDTKNLILEFLVGSLISIYIYTFFLDMFSYFGLSNEYKCGILSFFISIFNFCILKKIVKINSSTKPIDKKIYLIPHADDFGISLEISNNILDCIMYKSISRVSVICNINKAALRNRYFNIINHGLHLNLVEGKPITNKKYVSHLINGDGEFKFSFFSLLCSYYLASRRKREILHRELKLEIESQLKEYMKLSKDSEHIHLDGHTHIHMLPFILDILLELKQTFKITSVRLPREKFYFGAGIAVYFSSNLIKHILLNFLCSIQIKKIQENELKYNDYFIGVLSTGVMNILSLNSALAALSKVKHDIVVEVLFHPGFVNDKNKIDWTAKGDFINYYSSMKRKREKEMLCSKEFRDFMSQFQIMSRL